MLARRSSVDVRIEAHGVCPGCAHQPLDLLHRGPFRKYHNERIRLRASNAANDLNRRLNAPALETIGIECAGPGFKDLNYIGAGAKLTNEMICRGRDQPADNFPK